MKKAILILFTFIFLFSSALLYGQDIYIRA